MTVTANTTRNDYTAGSAQSVYNYTFQLNDAADVDVYLNGVKQTLNTHYTVQNVDNASGGTITFTLVDENGASTPPPENAIINIVMAMDLDRDTNYQPSGAFLASDVNNDFDRLWHSTNQQQTAINRSLRLQDTDVTTSSMELPLKDARKGKLLAFNATTGDPEATSNNQSNWDSAYNDIITSASFSGGNYTLTQRDGGTITTSLDGRYLKLSGGNVTGMTTFTEGLFVNQNKALGFNGGQLVLGTSGTESFIRESAAGDLSIEAANLYLRANPTINYITATYQGAVSLYHNNSVKLATTSGGISVTGTITATGYNSSNWDTAYNDKINAVNYSNNTLTLTQQDGSTLTTTINGGGGGGTATGVDLADNVIATFGDDNDLQIYHDGSNSYVKDTGTGYLILGNSDAGTIIKNGSGQNLLTTTASEIRLGHQGNTKLATKSTGIDVTGNVSLPDNGKATFGASDDLQIYHDGSNSYVTDAGTGGLYLRGSNEIALRSSSNENIFLGLTDGSAYVYHNGSVKLQTTSTGIDVTGSVTAKVGSYGTKLTYSNSNQSGIIDTYGNHNLEFRANNDRAMNIAANGDVSFYEDTGTTPKFFWDASTERLGIGTTSPQDALHINSDTTDARLLLDGHTNFDAELKFAENGSVKYTVGHDAATDSFRIGTANVDTNPRLVIDSSGKVGIGTASPDAILHTAKAVNSGDVPNILENAGTSGTCTSSLVFSGNGGGGVEKARIKAAVRGDGFMAFHTNNDTEKMRIDSSGNVGIGTSSPATKLAVHGGTSGTDVDVASFNSASGALNIQCSDLAAANPTWTLRSFAGEPIAFAQATSERMRIDASGNLLVGTTDTNPLDNNAGSSADNGIVLGGGKIKAATNASIVLDVNRTGTDGEIARFRKDGTTVGSIGTASTDLYLGSGVAGLRFREAGPQLMPWNTTTNTANDNAVDIGKTDARFKDLYLSGKVYGDGSELTNLPAIANVVEDTTPQLGGDLDCNSKALTGASKYISNGGTSYNPAFSFSGNTSTGMYQPASGTIGFSTNTSERMRITSSGNIGIGTTSPSAKLHVNGQSRASSFYATSTGSQIHNAGFMGSAGLLLRHSASSTSTNFQQMLEFRNSSYGVVGSIKSHGSATQYNTSSDERLKENIQDSGDAGSKIDAIQIRQFDWKGSGEHQDFGVIAQELQTVAPEAVSEGYTEDDIMGVDYSKLVPTLIKEIQTLRNRVAQLENN